VDGGGREDPKFQASDFVLNLNSVGTRRKGEQEKGDRATPTLYLSLSCLRLETPQIHVMT
jgi:hypothetical protein